MTPVPVAAAGAATVVQSGPTWSSEIRRWLPSLIIGIVVIVVIIGGLIFSVNALFNYFDGQCEDEGYDTLLSCAIGQTGLGDTVRAAGSGILTAFLWTNPLTAPFLIRRRVRSGIAERLRGRLSNPFK